MEAEGAEGTARSAVRCGAHDPGWVTPYSRCVPLSFPPPPPIPRLILGCPRGEK